LNGCADYFTPQLYWPIDRPGLSYPVLLQWWVEQNVKGRHIWPGNYLDKVNGTSTGWPATEILDQIALTRQQRGATGNVYFSMRSFMFPSDGITDKLQAGPYEDRALVPASTWIDSVAPSTPVVRVGRDVTSGSSTVSIDPQGTEPVWQWLIQTRYADSWRTDIYPGTQRFFMIPKPAAGKGAEEIAVSAIDRVGNLSEMVLKNLADSTGLTTK
jgi:hypothetical protein